MAICLACDRSTPPGVIACPCCGSFPIDDTTTATITVPVDVLRMLCGMAERFVAEVDPLERGPVAAGFYRAVDLVEASARCGPLTITGAVAASITSVWETAS